MAAHWSERAVLGHFPVSAQNSVPASGACAEERAAEIGIPSTDPENIFKELDGAWMSAYDLTEVWPAYKLTPSAWDVLHSHVAKVYDAAVREGYHPAGIAPANSRRGKYVVPIPGNPIRVYCGLPKLPHQSGTQFSHLAF